MDKNFNLRGPIEGFADEIEGLTDKIEGFTDKIEGFTDKIEGELERHKIAGVPITRKVSLTILCCISFVIVTVGVAIGASIDKHLAANEYLSNEERHEKFTELLLPVVGSTVMDETSPEYRAVQWMAEKDPARMPVHSHIDLITQRFALADLFESTQGSNWQNSHNFMSDKDVCDWNLDDGENGVYCRNGFVARIQLGDLGLDGTVPRSLGLLTHLEYLNLEANKLHGSLPNTVGLWTKLTHLDMREYFFLYRSMGKQIYLNTFIQTNVHFLLHPNDHIRFKSIQGTDTYRTFKDPNPTNSEVAKESVLWSSKAHDFLRKPEPYGD